MPLPRWLARANRYTTNRITGPAAGHLPGFGIVVHTGRTTGRTYRTPVNVFGTHTGYAVALTYGPDSQWVRNVLAAGACDLETRGHTERLTVDRVVHDEDRRAVPWLVRQILGALDVADFLLLDRRGAAGSDERGTGVE
jgi:deazaflavin-dependent oxidoreductase (nitroreductase family)